MIQRAARTDAILDATLRLLADIGYDRLTMDAVASRAGASKATIYRRWPGKPDLVLAALSRHSVSEDSEDTVGEGPDTGSVRKDLIATLARMRDSLAGQDGALVLGLINAMRTNVELAGTVRAELVAAKSSVIADVVRRAIARDELPASANSALAAELASALVFTRLLVTKQPVDDGELGRLVDTVLLPVLTSEPPSTRRRQ
ncbi:TetR/AcrR family transcriptional regulator [Mycobacterium sp.]|uniref:TetR/AcrR family transcriptional regulator n=1 Tax=Mycobacterium sp. TaxID=1785 RepID=UPI002D78C977|nr:TetR/AcrR family transcriptional regulator [Mycobacterium sp.]